MCVCGGGGGGGEAVRLNSPAVAVVTLNVPREKLHPSRDAVL